MKKSRSRIIALLLSLVYCFTLATGVVFAEEVEDRLRRRRQGSRVLHGYL